MRQIIYVVATFLAVMIMGTFVLSPEAQPDFPREISWFSGASTQGGTFSKDNLRGKWTLAYFGYTNCPDLCPNTLAAVKQAVEGLEQSGPHIPNLNVLFVTIDPQRDTLDHLRDYLGFYDPKYVGLHTEITQLVPLFSTLDASQSVRRESNDADYLMAHPTSLYIFDPESRWAAQIKEPITPARIKEALEIAAIASPQGSAAH